MTNKVKTKLLYNLNLLKTMGYDYCEPLNIKFCDSINEFDLPDNLDRLQKIVENCNLCDISKARLRVDFSQGNKKAEIIFIDEMPSIIDDKSNKLLIGKSGEMLINMCEKVLNTSYENFYFTNIIKCKTLSLKEPILNEINSCKIYLNKQLEIIKPKLIIALGENSFFNLINTKTSFEENRGKIIKYNGVDLIPIYHPNYLLRNPSAKKEAYIDMLKIKNLMENM